jgi:hypothetical protein
MKNENHKNTYLTISTAGRNLQGKGLIYDICRNALPNPPDPISGLAHASRHTVSEILHGAAEFTSLHAGSQAGAGLGSAPDPQHHGLPRLVLAALKAPRDFTLALTQGFENCPRRLYSQEPGPRNPEITGLRTGCVAAGKVSALTKSKAEKHYYYIYISPLFLNPKS